MLYDLISKGIEKFCHRRLNTHDDCLSEEWREEDGFHHHPFAKLIQTCEASGIGSKEDLRDWEADIVSIFGESTLGYHSNIHRQLEGSCEGESGDSSPEGIFPNGRVIELHQDLSHCINLGEYGDVKEICAHAFELGVVWLSGSH